ncbi:fatty acid desaturase [Halalkalibacter sp. APA_J-10(15)]|uniref:fatty acid desaturase n=1 Tax=unclassified Halalkalibacter TaxID=2893063 RepID=UPI001FF32F34|nr:fatty acid desaturase [Halalkalibacter sp. APA_J-10(15)]MCK0472000.1 fatty acid desaturase [Halalkalibacter sp. APA_J-10(15)]
MSNQKLAQLRKKVVPFENSDQNSSLKQIVNTIPPFFILWGLAYMSLTLSIWLTLFFSIIAAGFAVRIFIIFHDCCHGSFLKNKKMNTLLGTITGIMTMFPFEKWKWEHSMHHASSGNLDKRGIGDMWVMTVDEYVNASFKERLAYRLYRNPLVMFGLGPAYLFLITNRINRKKARKKERLNLYVTNISIVLIYAFMIWLIGWQAFFIIQGTVMFVSGMLGIWLFYIQHQFEDSYFEDEQEWDYVKAAIDGSSYYKLPKVLQWITGNIGYHHVHHLSPRVPNYHLQTVHETVTPLQKATTVSIKTSLQAIRFRLYDEESKTFVTFKDIKQELQKNKKTIQLEKRRLGLQGK